MAARNIRFPTEADYGIREDGFSEDDNDLSSDDDPEAFLNDLRGFQEQNSDEFEDEMDKELDNSFRQHLKSSNVSGAASSSKGSKQTETKYYDDIYFDSDEDSDGESSKKKKKDNKRMLSNDEMLYDPNMDDEDQKWVDKMRRESRAGGSQESTSDLPKSDAVLDCPCCMTTLCRDCQKHSLYPTQYRAIFVTNCNVLSDKTLSYPKADKKRRKRKKRKGDDEQQSESELYNPVECTVCHTQVAVYDKDEVYHFFNVLSGPA